MSYRQHYSVLVSRMGMMKWNMRYMTVKRKRTYGDDDKIPSLGVCCVWRSISWGVVFRWGLLPRRMQGLPFIFIRVPLLQPPSELTYRDPEILITNACFVLLDNDMLWSARGLAVSQKRSLGGGGAMIVPLPYIFRWEIRTHDAGLRKISSLVSAQGSISPSNEKEFSFFEHKASSQSMQ